MKKTILLSALSLSLLVACGGGNDEDPTENNDETEDELQGTWVSSCVSYSSFYLLSSTTFSVGSYSSSSSAFFDSECADSVQGVSVTGSFVVGEAITTSSGVSAKEIDFIIETIDGVSASETSFGIYRIMDNTLFTGNLGFIEGSGIDTSTEENRPTALNFDLPFTKI